MRSKYLKQIISGASTGLIVWLLLTIADAVDELILDENYLCGAFVFFLTPIIMFIIYIINCIKFRPGHQKLLAWLLSYSTVCAALWLIIYYALSDDNYIIKQKCRTEGIDLNGIEYIFYGYSVLIGFLALCLIYHFIDRLIKRKKHLH